MECAMPNLQFWIELFPDESIEKGKQVLEELHLNIKVKKHKPKLWTVHAGHQLLLKTTSEEAVEALLYGMALTYHAMPKPMLTELRKIFDRDAGLTDSKE
jgi:hypothetical protein